MEDPLVLNLAMVGSLDPDYLQLMQLVERRGRAKDLPASSELKTIEGSLEELRVVEMSTGDRLLSRGSAVYVPASMRGSIMDTLHLTHAAPQSMLESARDRIFWPKMRAKLHSKFLECKE